MNEMKVYLTLIGDRFDPEEVSAEIGMSADAIRLADEALRNGRRFGHTEWGIQTAKKRQEELEPLMLELFARLPCSPHRLYEIAQAHAACWHVLILVETYGDEPPILIFSEDTIQFLAAMHAQMGFDNYIYEEAESEVMSGG